MRLLAIIAVMALVFSWVVAAEVALDPEFLPKFLRRRSK